MRIGPEGVARAFVALPCPPELRNALAEARPGWRELGADVRWVDPGAAHLTLRFLGRSPRDALASLDRALAGIAAATGPVALVPGEPGAFPGWRRPRVLWLGLDDGGALAPLAAAIEEAAVAAGFPPEPRVFRPHLTLGRVRSPRGAARAVTAVQEWRPRAATETVSEIVLYESETGSAGPRHTAIAAYALTGRRT